MLDDRVVVVTGLIGDLFDAHVVGRVGPDIVTQNLQDRSLNALYPDGGVDLPVVPIQLVDLRLEVADFLTELTVSAPPATPRARARRGVPAQPVPVPVAKSPYQAR